MHLADLLLLGLQRLASDIHLSASAPALARIHGDLQALTPHALEAAEVQQLLHSCMTPAQREQFAAGSDLDFAWSHDGHRFRVHVFHQARGPAAALRLIAARIPSLQELAAPPVLAKLALQPRGLVIVTGPTGAGKSTTLASMLQHRCQQQPCHALTLEDPIEFVHAPAQGLVHQREIGSHCASFAQGLRSALRADPDVILLGEMRDAESIRFALTAAETGHLVLTSLHSASAVQAIDRIVDVFSGDEKTWVRSMLAEVMQAILGQTLCQRANGAGRMAAYEILVATPAVRHLVREGKLAQISSHMQTGSSSGMVTRTQSLQSLVERGLITPEEMQRHLPTALAPATAIT